MNAEQKLQQSINGNIDIKSVKLNDITLNYVVSGSGKNLIFLHGANIGWGQWYPNISFFSKEFRVFAVDLPGSGNSTRINFSKSYLEKDFVAKIYEFIENLKLEKVNIIGHSFGAWIGMKLALLYPEKVNKLILLNPLGLTAYVPLKYRLIAIKPIAEFVSKNIMRPTKKNMSKFLLSVLYDKRNVVSEEFINYFYESVTGKNKISHPLMFISRISGILKIPKELILIDSLKNIICPTLVMLSQNDPLVSFQEAYKNVKLIPNLRIQIFFQTGHVISLERSSEFNELSINFLQNKI